MEINNLEQIRIFFNAFIIGILIGFILDLFKFLRITINFKDSLIVIQDFLFFFISGLVSMFYIVFFGDGKIRFYIILAQIIGFLVYHFMISHFILKIYILILNRLRGLFKIISIKIIRPIVFLFVKINFITKKPILSGEKKIKKIIKINKFNLKRHRIMLYNLINKKMVVKSDKLKNKKKFKN